MAADDRYTLGDFRVRGVLGQGGSGTVYDAEWGPRQVALKVLREELVPTARERERFLAEAELLRAVDHPSVVKVLGAGTLPGGRPYVVMERLEGESLATRLDRGPFRLDEAMACFEQLASAVAALHERGLIHRDIKPENVILTDRHAVLLDLGIAKPGQAQPSTTSQEGSLRGTPAYMAPERFFGTPASVATDIYELTVVLYMLVTGRLPWADPTDPSARLNLPRPSEIGCPLPPAFETELLTGLSTRAEARPTSVVELAARMRRALAHRVADEPRDTAELPGPRPRGATERDRERVSASSATTLPARRRRQRTVLLGAAVLTTVGLATGLVLGRVGSQRPAEPASVAPPAPPPPAPPAPGPAPSSPPPAAPRGELPAAVGELLALHPGTTQILVSGSPTQLRDSELVKTALTSPEGAAMIGHLQRLGVRCPADLLLGVEAFAVGLEVGDDAALDLSSRGDFSRDGVEACLADLLAKGTPAAATRHDAITSLSNGGDTVWLAWPDARTLVASVRPTIDLEWMQARVAGRDSLRGQPALMTLLERVDAGATLWLVAAPQGSGAPLLPGTDPPLGMYASLWLTNVARLRAGLRYATAADAEKNAPLLQTQLDTVKQNPFGMMLLKDASFAVAGDEVIFTLTLDETTSMLTQQALLQMAQ